MSLEFERARQLSPDIDGSGASAAAGDTRLVAELRLYGSVCKENGIPEQIVGQFSDPAALIFLDLMSAPNSPLKSVQLGASNLHARINSPDGVGIQMAMLHLIADHNRDLVTRFHAGQVIHGTQSESVIRHLLEWVKGGHPADSPLGPLPTKYDPYTKAIIPPLDQYTREYAAMALRTSSSSAVAMELAVLINPHLTDTGGRGLATDIQRALAALALPYQESPAAVAGIGECLNYCANHPRHSLTPIIAPLLIVPFTRVGVAPESPAIQTGVRRLMITTPQNEIHNLLRQFDALPRFTPPNAQVVEVMFRTAIAEDLESVIRQQSKAHAAKPTLITAR